MTINQIKPSKVKTAKVLVKDYHLEVGQIIKVYWNKDSKEYRTIDSEVDQNGKGYCGNWTVKEENIEFIK